MLDILYVSEFCSDVVFNDILNSSVIKPSQSCQKYHKLLFEGLSYQDEVFMIESISKVPVNFKSHKKLFWNIRKESKNKIRMNYAPLINLPIIRTVTLMIYSFFKTLLWRKTNNDKVIICDVLSLSVTIGVLFAAKINGFKCIGIVTDLPYYQERINLKSKIIKGIVYHFISMYDAYILMTEKMNEIVNVRRKPYCIIEGLVDINMQSVDIISEKAFPRDIMYTGALLETFGLKVLIEAFMTIKNEDITLSIYGGGPMEKDIIQLSKKDKRIRYFGVVNNDDVVKEQLKATLLVNTRLTNIDFAEYSFPSKNIEYMVSGTPVVTTALSGIPYEYFDYVYIFDDETVNGIALTLNKLLSMPYCDLLLKGTNAKNFVLKNKNNYSQALMITNFIHNNWYNKF